MRISGLILALLIGSLAFGQASEDPNNGFQYVYSMVIKKEGVLKHYSKEGSQLGVEIKERVTYGKWYFKGFPDTVVIKKGNGDTLLVTSLNSEKRLHFPATQSRGGMSFGVGFGAVGVATGSGGGSGYQSFTVEKYEITLEKRLETQQEKNMREHAERKELDRLAKEAAKKAKKEARKAKKNQAD